jgi:hypothetical protein
LTPRRITYCHCNYDLHINSINVSWVSEIRNTFASGEESAEMNRKTCETLGLFIYAAIYLLILQCQIVI